MDLFANIIFVLQIYTLLYPTNIIIRLHGIDQG